MPQLSDSNNQDANHIEPHAAGDYDGVTPALTDISAHKIAVTFFPDQFAVSQECIKLTLPDLARLIGQKTGTDKMALPWLKLATFGKKRSEANCLRTNENLLQI